MTEAVSRSDPVHGASARIAPARKENPPVKTRRALFATGLGNSLEWYDWTLYAVLSPFFARHFFNPDDPTSALLSTLAIFAAGFVARPFGGIIFGWFGDKYGRKKALTISMLLVAFGSVALGLLPTYEVIGAWASLILLMVRIIQGLAHGGEVASSYTYVAEIAPSEKRGRWSSILYSFVTLGVVTANVFGAGLSAILGEEAMGGWGWRIPFLVGGLLGLFVLYMRRTIPETEQFQANREIRDKESVLQTLWSCKWAMLRIMGMFMGGTVAYYTWAIQAPAYAINQYHVPATTALVASVVANMVFLGALLAAGSLSDKVGRKPVMYVYFAGFPIIAFPLTQILGPSAWQLFIAMAIALVFMGCNSSITPVFWAENVPSSVRALAIGIPMSIGAIFGGTAPYLQAYFASHHSPSAFTFYLIATCLVGLTALYFSPETRGTVLK